MGQRSWEIKEEVVTEGKRSDKKQLQRYLGVDKIKVNHDQIF